MNPKARSPVWGEPLLHPVCLLSMAVWWLNDHLGKVYAPSALTGKASDVAGLIVFPLWVWCLLDRVAASAVPRVYSTNRTFRLATLYVVTTAVCVWFALMNVSESVGATHRDLWTWIYGNLHAVLARVGGYWPTRAHHTVDARDLWTLPAALVAVWIGRRSIVAGTTTAHSVGFEPGTGFERS